MLLLPLGCALLGFLSWQRFRKPAAGSLLTIGDDTQERISNESDSSLSDMESALSDHQLNEFHALEDYPLEVFHDFKAGISAHIPDSDGKDSNDQGLLLYTELEIDYDEQISASRMFEKEYDAAETKTSDTAELQGDLLIMTDSDGALSCTEEEVLFPEMQLELESFESLYHEVPEHSKWIEAAPHADRRSNSKDAGWKEHISLDNSCSKYAGKRSKASSISSILSTGSTGSTSMMSSTISSASSASTWSACSEDRSSMKNAGGLRNGDDRSGRKIVGGALESVGKRSTSRGIAVAGGCGRVGMTGKGWGGGRMRVVEREGDQRERRINASRGGRGGVLAHRGERAAVVSNENDVSRHRVIKGDGGKWESASGGVAVGGGGGGRGKRGGVASDGGGNGGGRAGKEGAGSVVRAHKLGVKRVSAEIERSGAASREQQQAPQAISDSNNHYYSRNSKGPKGKVSSGGKGTLVNTTTQQQQRAGLVNSNRHPIAGCPAYCTRQLSAAARVLAQHRAVLPSASRSIRRPLTSFLLSFLFVGFNDQASNTSEEG
ncbi:hypothetical protein GOP47_0008302 [Adiantum capillus-veneris]|uniref:Uncharacterized protein n=1 Tax=Adiantum capillus-veneris TaxID=13818 RepID=A0A9D4ZJJ7_ADICA|nr:hypothetical protein GOP47_0008302 [Adiantum capillus-veneris]